MTTISGLKFDGQMCGGKTMGLLGVSTIISQSIASVSVPRSLFVFRSFLLLGFPSIARTKLEYNCGAEGTTTPSLFLLSINALISFSNTAKTESCRHVYLFVCKAVGNTTRCASLCIVVLDTSCKHYQVCNSLF